MALGTLHSFDMHRGDDRGITYTVVDEAAAAVDITGATFIWILARQDPSVTEPQPIPGTTLKSKTESTGVVIVDAANGLVRVDLDSADTVGLVAPLDYYHELQIRLAGKTTTVAFGKITLKREIAAPGP